jgi:hypothetical protein
VLSPEDFVRRIWDGVFAQFVSVDIASSHIFGWYQLYDLNLAACHAKIAIARIDTRRGMGAKFWTGAALAADYAFGNWPLRKLYAEIAEYNCSKILGAVGHLLQPVTQLPEHVYLDGNLWDLHIFAIMRDIWHESELRASLLNR